LDRSTRKTRRALPAAIGLLVAGGVFLSLVVTLPRIQSERRWAALQSRGVLRIGTDPGVGRYSFFGPDGWAGLDADVGRALGSRLGLRIEVVPVGYDGFYDALATERVDVSMSALSPDPARAADVLYSRPYIDAGVRLVGAAGQRYASIDDLRHAAVAVVLGGDADAAARYAERRVAGFERVPQPSAEAALTELERGAVAWALVDGRDVAGGLCRAVEARTELRGEYDRCVALQPRPFVIAARRDDARLMDEINRALGALQADGVLDAAAAIWLAAPP
jgi:ABC-type amino acid transport substrate-binding protein